jgi:transcription elongation factor Elf1
MSERIVIYTCPMCNSDRITVTEEHVIMINTLEHYCHSVKAHDSDAKVSCLECNWSGIKQDLL